MLPNQGHEPGVAQGGLPDLDTEPLDEREGLRAVSADGHQQASSGGELLHEGRRDCRPAGGDEDRVIRGVRAPAERPVAQQDGHVRDARLPERLPGREGEGLDPLDREHLRRERGEERRLVARARADLEHPLPAREAQRFKVAGVCERLRDRLIVPDRERGVLIGPVAQRYRDEPVSRRLGERLEDCEVAHALGAKRLDEPCPVARVRVRGRA